MSDQIVAGNLTSQQLDTLGINRREVRRTARRLMLRGEMKGLSREEMASAVLDEIASGNPQAFQQLHATVGIDWEGLLAFIERLLPFILQIIALF